MAGHHISPTRTYYVIFGTLMVMTAVTVLVAFINIGILNFPIALTIAIFKATLVILFFMHAKYSSRLTKLIVGGAFFFLAILLTMTMTDYLSRGWYASERGTTTAGTLPNVGPAPPEEPAPAGAEGAKPGGTPPAH